ncbi:SDR family NAD(P)-dependent oxidoreductase, partial [Pseudomonas sp. CM25]
MSEPVHLQDRVVIVTGAGGGLGRAHALLFAARGARVVVNDLGGSTHGEGASASAADRVVEQIRAAGGSAIANHDSVSHGARIVEQALDSFGRVDVLVNNAGILRDRTFHKMDDSDWEQVYQVHVEGAFKVTRAAWPHLREQNWGRVI